MTENQDNQAVRDVIEQPKEKMNEIMTMKDQMNELLAMKDQRNMMAAIQDQMANIMKLIEKKTADESTSVGDTGNAATSLPPPHNSGFDGQGYQWPPYGLPVGYTPATTDATLKGAPTEVVNPNHNVSSGQNETPQVQIPVSTAIPLVASTSYTPPLVTSHQAPVHNLGNSSRSYIPHMSPAAFSMARPYNNMQGFPLNYSTGDPQPKDRYQVLEERLRAIEGSNTGARDAYDLCLVPNVVIPPKFKVLDFDKYKGGNLSGRSFDHVLQEDGCIHT